MKVIWSKTSLIRAGEIAEYIACDSKVEAGKWINRLFKETDRIRIFPQIGRIVPNFNNNSIRELVYGNYRIIYEIKASCIVVLTIWNFKRLLTENDLEK